MDTDTISPRAEPAGLGRRLAAMLYDALVLLGTFIVLTIIVMALRGWREIAPGTWWFQLLLLGASAAFFCGFWLRGGQTLGMLAWKIRVERANGGPLRWRDALLRFAAAILSLLPAGLGYWWSLVDPARLTWHDRLSHTRLVRVS